MTASLLPRLGVLLGFLVPVLLAGCAAAACPEPGSEIATDRPDVGNSSLVVPTGSVQAENGLNLSARDGTRFLDGTNSRIRLGVAPCLEILVDLPSYVAADRAGAITGWSNASPALKWQLGPLPADIDLSATMGLGLPTGTAAVTGPGLQPYLQFPWSRAFADGWGISGMVTAFAFPSEPNRAFDTQATLVLSNKITPRLELFAEYVLDVPLHGGPTQLINSGAAFHPTPLQQLDFHFAFGLNRNAPDYVVGLGYSLRIDRLF
jgi:hypothetical protein